MADLRNNELWERAERLMPAGVNSPVRAFRHVGRPPVFFKSAIGPFLHDVEGKAYIDFCLSFGPLIFGHSPTPVVNAVKEQVEKGTCLGACHPFEGDLAELILKAYPAFEKVRLVNSGTEAVMTAVRLARGVTKRSKIVKFESCYHGHSDGLLVKAGSGVLDIADASSAGVPPTIAGETLVARFDDLSSFHKILEKYREEIACVILELVPANDGLTILPGNILKEIFDSAHSIGALVIADEVITGFRSGLGGATAHFDLNPDIVTLGKIIGGGLPLAALSASRTIMDHLAPQGNVYQAGTLSGNLLACVAGIATLEELYKNPPYEELAKRTQEFTRRLSAGLSKKWSVKISQFGSIFWLKFTSGFPEFYQECLAKGVYFAPSPYEVNFLSTAHTEAVLERVLERLCGK